VPDIYLYPGETKPADVRLSDPTVLRSGLSQTFQVSDGWVLSEPSLWIGLPDSDLVSGLEAFLPVYLPDADLLSLLESGTFIQTTISDSVSGVEALYQIQFFLSEVSGSSSLESNTLPLDPEIWQVSLADFVLFLPLIEGSTLTDFHGLSLEGLIESLSSSEATLSISLGSISDLLALAETAPTVEPFGEDFAGLTDSFLASALSSAEDDFVLSDLYALLGLPATDWLSTQELAAIEAKLEQLDSSIGLELFPIVDLSWAEAFSVGESTTLSAPSFLTEGDISLILESQFGIWPYSVDQVMELEDWLTTARAELVEGSSLALEQAGTLSALEATQSVAESISINTVPTPADSTALWESGVIQSFIELGDLFRLYEGFLAWSSFSDADNLEMVVSGEEKFLSLFREILRLKLAVRLKQSLHVKL